MPRTAPSRADQHLMNAAAAAGHPVSAAQLERWRQHGLLPRPRVDYMGRAGTRTEYPPGTEELVLSLARHAGPRRSVDDLALMAFFDGAPVPESALKLALARVYFTSRFSQEDEVAKVAASVPQEWRGELTPQYEEAEAEARLDLERGGRAIRQMRINLRRVPELSRAPRAEVDERLLGVLTGLNLPELPEDDLAFMADLEAALALDSDVESNDPFPVWEMAAINHASQMARREETSPEERLDRLVHASMDELDALRHEVRTALDQTWTRATGGREDQAHLDRPRTARGAGSTLVEWMSAKLAHPPGSSLSDRYFIESLADLQLRCFIATARRMSDGTATGEGRAAFIARTTGATGKRRRQ
ncbi:hypothetical protein ACFUKV_03270 [Streptomyces paradoxus]|uniref:hypothetical protein n=1 Tax=Streptomyces paradoxus TaxID=66375 RepID=UPI00362610C1